jgi:cysteine desulfurase
MSGLAHLHRPMDIIDLDHNATTAPSPAVIDAVVTALRSGWGNPSSIHQVGMAARHAVELARESVASLVGCTPREVVFTSGGTESCSQAIRGSIDAWRVARAAGALSGGLPLVVTTRLEHSAVRECVSELESRGVCAVHWLAHTDGAADLGALESLVRGRAADIALVSLMWANNETGALLDAPVAARICRGAGVRFHTDATQWVGKMPTDFRALGADLMTFSAHKFHGPKGVGALVVRRGVELPAEIVGGPQERGRRGGTENVPGIVGMGAAARESAEWLADDAHIRSGRAVRDAFEQHLQGACPECVPLRPAQRLWNTCSVGFPRLASEAMLLLLSERGICASAGAACSSGSLEPSPVIAAMGLPPEVAHGTLRFTTGRETTIDQVSRAAAVIGECARRLAGAA